MVAGDLFGAGEIGDRAGDAEDAVVGAGGDTELLHRVAEGGERLGGEAADAPDLAGGQRSVRAARAFREAGALAEAGGLHAGADVGARFPGARAAELVPLHAGHRQPDVDAVEERTGDAPPVGGDLGRGAGALGVGDAVVSTAAWMRCPFAT